MKILDAAKKFFSDDKNEIENNNQYGPSFAVSSSSDLFYGDYTSSNKINDRNALTVSAIWASVSLISGVISSLPVEVRSIDGGEPQLLDDDPLALMLNKEWCARWSAAAAWQYLGLSKLFHGDAFAEIKRRGADVVGLIPIHPYRVNVHVWPDGSRLSYSVSPEAGVEGVANRIIDQDDMIHVTSMGFDGCRSISPLRHALSVVGSVALATQDHAQQFFNNAARPDYAISYPSEVEVDKQKQESLKQQISENHNRTNGNAHRPMILTAGAKIMPISLPNEDAELLATREFQVEEIARIYGIPPFMIGHTKGTSDWGSGISERSIAFKRYVLAPHLDSICNEMNRKFFPREQKQIAFNTFEFERADLKTMITTFREAMGRAGEEAILTREEVRRALKFPSKPVHGEFKSEELNNAQ